MASLRAGKPERRRDMRGYVIPFLAAMVAFGVGFLALDYAVMSFQGLTLIFQPINPKSMLMNGLIKLKNANGRYVPVATPSTPA